MPRRKLSNFFCGCLSGKTSHEPPLTPNPRVKGGKTCVFLGSREKNSIREWSDFHLKYTIESAVLC